MSENRPHLGPGGLRLESALGRYMSAEQLRALDAAQDRALAPFWAIGDIYDRENNPACYSTLAACTVSWESIESIDPYAPLYVDLGGES